MCAISPGGRSTGGPQTADLEKTKNVLARRCCYVMTAAVQNTRLMCRHVQYMTYHRCCLYRCCVNKRWLFHIPCTTTKKNTEFVVCQDTNNKISNIIAITHTINYTTISTFPSIIKQYFNTKTYRKFASFIANALFRGKKSRGLKFLSRTFCRRFQKIS